jgi:hypothetical protein
MSKSSVSWQHYNNTEYIRIDFGSIKYNNEKAIEIFNESVDYGLERSDKSVRALILTQGVKLKPETVRVLKKIGKTIQPKMKKSAIVGAVGILNLLVKIYIAYTGSNLKFFTNEKAALEYLTQD